MAEKTEKATPKKLRDARKKGQVAKSQDLPSAFTFIVSIFITLALSGTLFTILSGTIITAFSLIPRESLLGIIPNLFMESFSTILYASFPVLLAVAVTGVIVNFLCVGPVFSVEVFKFDIKKFDPIKNLKNKFKLKTLVELIKSILKISVAGWLIYDVMYESLPTLIKTVSLPPESALYVFHAFLMEVVIKVGLFFIVVAVLDFAYQKHDFAKEMKMEKFEVKQEYKNTEGDPQIKGKRRQIAQEIAYSDAPSAGVKQAAAVVTNPTHLAIAIAYDKEVDAAPYITTMGEGLLAERIIKLAEKFGVPVVRNIKLARRLWEEGGEYEYVPEDTYTALAEIIRWVRALKTENEFDYQDPES